MLGETWTVDANPNEIFAYASKNESFGRDVANYISQNIPKLEKFVQLYGDMGKKELNSIVSTHKIIVHVDDNQKPTRHTACDVQDGVLRIIFNENAFAMFQSDGLHELDKALDKASAANGAVTFIARKSIEKDYEPEIGGVQKEIGEILAMPDIKLVPNFEENAKMLAAHSGKDWQPNFGRQTLAIFKQTAEGLKKAKFHEDDMLQEALGEALEKKEIQLKVVQKDKFKTRESWSEVILQDGAVVLHVSTMVP